MYSRCGMQLDMGVMMLIKSCVWWFISDYVRMTRADWSNLSGSFKSESTSCCSSTHRWITPENRLLHTSLSSNPPTQHCITHNLATRPWYVFTLLRMFSDGIQKMYTSKRQYGKMLGFWDMWKDRAALFAQKTTFSLSIRAFQSLNWIPEFHGFHCS